MLTTGTPRHRENQNNLNGFLGASVSLWLKLLFRGPKNLAAPYSVVESVFRFSEQPTPDRLCTSANSTGAEHA